MTGSADEVRSPGRRACLPVLRRNVSERLSGDEQLVVIHAPRLMHTTDLLRTWLDTSAPTGGGGVVRSRAISRHRRRGALGVARRGIVPRGGRRCVGASRAGALVVAPVGAGPPPQEPPDSELAVTGANVMWLGGAALVLRPGGTLLMLRTRKGVAEEE